MMLFRSLGAAHTHIYIKNIWGNKASKTHAKKKRNIYERKEKKFERTRYVICIIATNLFLYILQKITCCLCCCFCYFAAAFLVQLFFCEKVAKQVCTFITRIFLQTVFNKPFKPETRTRGEALEQSFAVGVSPFFPFFLISAEYIVDVGKVMCRICEDFYIKCKVRSFIREKALFCPFFSFNAFDIFFHLC